MILLFVLVLMYPRFSVCFQSLWDLGLIQGLVFVWT